MKIFQNNLAAAEAQFNTSFGVITKIEKAAHAAADAADEEAFKAEVLRDKFQARLEDMEATRKLYSKKARKISAFIDSLND